jgi:hypothetical protein
MAGSGSGTAVCDWPTLDELKQVLDITSDDWEVTAERVLESAIYETKIRVGDWDEFLDTPDCALAQYALRLAELISLRPEAAANTITDPTLERLMRGHRRKFGVA